MSAGLHRLCAIIHDNPEQAKAGIDGELSSSLRHSGLAQTGEISGFEQRANLGHSVICAGLQARNARITTVTA